MESPIFEYLRLVRAASYTAIVLAGAFIVCALAMSMIRNARERGRLRRLELERVEAEYRRTFERKGKP